MLGKALLSASVSAPPAAVYVEDVFQTWLYTGNGSTQTITNGIDLAGEGGLVWLKDRTNGNGHYLIDSERGINKQLRTYSTSEQTTNPYYIDALNANGFTLGPGNGNLNADPFVSWTFRKAPKFFDVVTWTGDGTNNRQITHSLGVIPGAILAKRTSSTADWYVYHRGLGSYSAYLKLNTTAASVDSGGAPWGATPTSTYFVTDASGSSGFNNATGETYVAYLFAHDAGGFGDAGTDSVVSCGSFTGGSTLNVTLGWEPQWVLVKGTSSGSWVLADIMRGASQTSISYLYANGSDAESTGGGLTLAPTATGFTVNPANLWGNQTYIYIAIRRGPMKTPTVGTEVFSAVAYAGNSSDDTTIQNLTTNIAADMAWISHRDSSSQNRQSFDKLRGSGRVLYQSGTNVEDDFGSAYAGASVSFSNTQTVLKGRYTVYGLYNTSGNTFAAWNFRRAPGFFDVVAYTGTGVARTVSHNLGVVPELMIIKERSASQHWSVYHKDLNAGGSAQQSGIYLSFDMEQFDSSIGWWNNTAPTSSVFSTGNASATNQSANTYIAYLFATLAGVSKVGSYTGTGTTKQIDCGFTAGARFVLIKRTDSTGDWYVWDTARGIISGNDPYLLLNSTAAEVTGTDYIDPLSSGFEISSTAPAAINANGGTYIFLAIA